MTLDNTGGTIIEFEDNLQQYLKTHLLDEHQAKLAKMDEPTRAKYYEQRAQAMIESRRESKMYASHYLPEEMTPLEKLNEEQRIDGFKKFGFYWPTKADLQQLAKDHPGFMLSDLVIDRIRFKKDGCGFTMLQLVFQKGIISPAFLSHRFDEEQETEENYLTAQFKKGEPKCIRVRVGDNQYVEKLQFLSTIVENPEPLKKRDERVIAEVKACSCGEDEVFEIDPKSEGYAVVGLFGIHKTDKNCWDDEPVRNLDSIRALGFITMRIKL